MGPIRGLKRRKRAEKKVDQNVLAAASLCPNPQPLGLDWWDDFSRRFSGPLSESRDSKKFEKVFKISRKTFDYICSLVKDDIMATKTPKFTDLTGKRLSLNDQVAVALRRLSSGASLSSIGDSFGMNQSTVAQVTWRFVEAMEEKGLKHLHWPSTEAEMEKIKSKFENIRGLPNCCGAIDITYIKMTLPGGTDKQEASNDVWLDQEKNCSMILQVVVDPEMRFRDIIAGWPGSLSDDLVLRSSGFFRLSEEGERLKGKVLGLPNGVELREYIVGDSGFPLLPWLLTPFQGKGLGDHQREFNKRQSATRMVARRALARLKGMWRIIQGVMWKPDKNKLPRIILVCCLLHNIIIDLEDDAQEELPLAHYQDQDLGYRQQNCESVDNTALLSREKLSLYLAGKMSP